jgi:hypothetical protein
MRTRNLEVLYSLFGVIQNVKFIEIVCCDRSRFRVPDWSGAVIGCYTDRTPRDLSGIFQTNLPTLTPELCLYDCQQSVCI